MTRSLIGIGIRGRKVLWIHYERVFYHEFSDGVWGQKSWEKSDIVFVQNHGQNRLPYNCSSKGSILKLENSLVSDITKTFLEPTLHSSMVLMLDVYPTINTS